MSPTDSSILESVTLVPVSVCVLCLLGAVEKEGPPLTNHVTSMVLACVLASWLVLPVGSSVVSDMRGGSMQDVLAVWLVSGERDSGRALHAANLAHQHTNMCVCVILLTNQSSRQLPKDLVVIYLIMKWNCNKIRLCLFFHY